MELRRWIEINVSNRCNLAVAAALGCTAISSDCGARARHRIESMHAVLAEQRSLIISDRRLPRPTCPPLQLIPSLRYENLETASCHLSGSHAFDLIFFPSPGSKKCRAQSREHHGNR